MEEAGSARFEPNLIEQMEYRMHSAHLLTPQQMYEADRLTIEGGILGFELMQNAGRAIADEICARWQPGRVAVLCGPGNNGGDGFVVARLLKERGWAVKLHLLGNQAALRGDAAKAASQWDGQVQALSTIDPKTCDLVIDALFGAGLNRPLEGELAQIINRLCESRVPVVGVDIPSGIDGKTGQIKAAAVRAVLTVTFFCKKPGHLLYPGRAQCGETIIADIGIAPSVLETIAPQTVENCPETWIDRFPQMPESGHKYHRGHTIAVSGRATRTGAARLAAMGALRAGSGLVTVASPSDAIADNAAHLTAIMLAQINGAEELSAMLKDTRINSIVLGPALGVNVATQELVFSALKSQAGVILDADAITAFEDNPAQLFDAIETNGKRDVILTPHHGEFFRLFNNLSGKADLKLEIARSAAKISSAVIILKGADTLIASPDGRCAINANAPSYLATAGSGDVLAGICAGLLAQAMPGFEAACAAVWIHGAAAADFGPGLIAEDLPRQMPTVLSRLTRLTGQ